MSVNYNDIKTQIAIHANKTINANFQAVKNLSVEKYECYKFPHILQTEIAQNLLFEMIMGAVVEYHNQLRNVFLDKGIDIGEMDCKSMGELSKEYKELQDERFSGAE